MTRADPSGEPSMEDILASIRKIIAEDPPGSRPAPEPRPQLSQSLASPSLASPSLAPSQAFRTLQRESEAPAQASVPSPEPYLRSGSQPFQPMSAFQSASTPEPRQAYADPFAAAPAPINAQPARSLSVDDQLSELLGEVPMSESMTAPAPIARPVSRSISASPGFIAKMTAQTVAQDEHAAEHQEHHHVSSSNDAGLAGGLEHAAAVANAAPALHAEPVERAQPEPAIAERAGFTVSRAGYIPDAPVEKNQHNPFDFQLGPSPFAGKLYAADPVLPSSTVPATEPALRANPANLGSIVPSRHFDFSETEEAHKPSLRMPRPVPGFEPRGEAHAAGARAEPAIEAAVAEPVVAAELEPIAASAVRVSPAIADVETQPAPVAIAEPVIEPNAGPLPQVMTLETLLPPSPVAIAEAAAPPVETPLPAAEIATPVVADESPAAQQGELAAEYLAENEAMTPDVEAEEAADDRDIGRGSMMYNGAQSGAGSSQFTPAFAHQQVAPYSEPNAPERSMEDTVAELLRPMLKNWLAENMPNIVERALRREIEESFALEHKPAAE